MEGKFLGFDNVDGGDQAVDYDVGLFTFVHEDGVEFAFDLEGGVFAVVEGDGVVEFDGGEGESLFVFVVFLAEGVVIILVSFILFQT